MSAIVSSGVTSTGIVLSGATWMNPDTLNVWKGGTANSTTILDNGKLAVSGGGIANDTIVGGGTLIVFSGGIASATAANSGSVVVSSGGTALAIKENGGCVCIADGAEAGFLPNNFSGLVLSNNRSATVHSGTTATDTVIDLCGGLLVSDGGIATGTAVSNGSLVVSDGGIATATTVNSVGRLTLFSGGKATGATVNSGGNLIVFSGGSATGATVSSGGGLTVYSGGYASDMTLKAGGKLGGFCLADDHYLTEIKDGIAVIAPSVTITGNEMTVSSGGTATGIAVSDRCSLIVSDGGSASCTDIKSGKLIVSGGGIATGTAVSSGGSFSIERDGAAADTTVYYGGDLIVSGGGSATGATVDSGGRLLVSSGGNVAGVTLKAGGRLDNFFFADDHYLTEIKDGVAVLAPMVTIAGSDLVVSGGGSISGTTVSSGGKVYVSSGGMATGTTVNDRCGMDVYGSASQTIIYNSFLTVADGGSATGTKVTAYGIGHVSGGGVMTDATINEQACVYVFSGGVTSDATVYYNGTLLVSSGGRAVGTTVNWDGSLVISEGGIAVGTTVTSGGKLHVSCGGIAINTTVSCEGEIYGCYCMHVSGGGMISGALKIVSGARVRVSQGAKIDFTVAGQSDPATALINDWSAIDDGNYADYSITVNAGQSTGNYILAGGAENFDRTIIVKTTAGDMLGYLSVGETKNFGGRDYTLAKSAGALTLTVGAVPAVSDYNKSGKSDMVQFVNGLVYVTHDTASGYVQTDAINDITGWNVTEIRRDLTGDGYADVQITSYDGASQTWVATLRNDYLKTGCITLNYQFIGAYETKLWSYLGSADVNADGKSEILMVQTDEGADGDYRHVAAWVTDENGTWIGNTWVGSLNGDWNVAGTADVTGDGADNVLLRRSDGMIGYWDKAGTNNIVELQNAGDRLWLTTGDFDGDGTADFLWKSLGSDEFSTWTSINGAMSDTIIGKESDLGGNWSFAGVGDYNGDGKDEILWCDATACKTAYGEASKAKFAELTVIV